MLDAIPAPVKEIDELQVELNNYVLNFPMPAKVGTCNFKLTQELDRGLNSIKAVGAHNCKYYGVNLVVFYLTADH